VHHPSAPAPPFLKQPAAYRICNGSGIMRACLETQKLEQLEACMDEIGARVARERANAARERRAPMKPSACRIERMLAKIEATLVPPPRKWLRVIIHEGDDEAEAKEKALAEHVARHPEHVGRKVEDFNWILDVIVRWPVR